MYIGPWQEYRLAQAQRGSNVNTEELKRQWQEELCQKFQGQDEERIREALSQLPAIPVKSRKTIRQVASKHLDITKTQVSNNNQSEGLRVRIKLPKPRVKKKKKKIAALTALDAVERRKQMYMDQIKEIQQQESISLPPIVPPATAELSDVEEEMDDLLKWADELDEDFIL